MAEAGAAPAAGQLTVTVVTPTGSVAAREFEEVVAPGELGQFGVLPGHIPFLGALKPGTLTLRSGQTREVFAVGPGYLQVGTENRVQILVEMAVPAARIDAGQARTEMGALGEKLKEVAPGPERTALEAQLAWAQARLETAEPGGKPPQA